MSSVWTRLRGHGEASAVEKNVETLRLGERALRSSDEGVNAESCDEDKTVTSTLRGYNKGSVLSTWADRRVLPILNKSSLRG